jgi:hypothetical protein
MRQLIGTLCLRLVRSKNRKSGFGPIRLVLNRDMRTTVTHLAQAVQLKTLGTGSVSLADLLGSGSDTCPKHVTFRWRVIHPSGPGLPRRPLKARPKRSRKAEKLDPHLTQARKPEASSPHILTSTLRWDESQFRIPESEGSACPALCRVSFQPGSRHIARSPADRQQVWTAGSELTGQLF